MILNSAMIRTLFLISLFWTQTLLASPLTDAILKATQQTGKATALYEDDFQGLRKNRSIGLQEFTASLNEPLKKRKSTGKSGSTFIKTQDNRFFIKSISEDELETFRKISADYFRYLSENPNSTLVPFFGLFEVHENLSTRNFVVMPNVLPSDYKQPRTYDLKGRAKKKHAKVRGSTLDDNQCPQPFQFEIPENVVQTAPQIRQDIKFLENQGIMDYSLFLIENEGVLARAYVIDYLTPYNWKKRVANFCKRMIWKSEQISTIPPHDYRTRMEKVVDRIEVEKKTEK
jgi:1-phosphatidylinositol-3-phosphate 5-kinase